tara:strand:- start:2690 stop:3754 length:1065 start_codon:yes stop_codon:yes gene_type:complete
LADEIYLHPRAAAAQRSYELDAARKLDGSYKTKFVGKNEFRLFFPNFMANGFGQPALDNFKNFARLSFPSWGAGSVLGRNEYDIRKAIQNYLRASEEVCVSVVKNKYAKTVHIDILYSQSIESPESISTMCARSADWIVRIAEAQAAKRTRFFKNKGADSEVLSELRSRTLKISIDESYFAFKSVFEGLVRYLLPDDVFGVVSEVLPSERRKHLRFKINYPRGGTYDTVRSGMDELFKDQETLLTADRKHELEAVRRVVDRSSATIVIVCFEKFVIRDLYGKDRDEWDGLVLELDSERTIISIVEAKNFSSAMKSENKAFTQLKATKCLLMPKRYRSARRLRLPGFGAILRVSI